MLRLAGVPSRVVLGYTAGTHNVDGSWTVTNHDAHAWVEAYFARSAGCPSIPTPLSDGRSQHRRRYLPTPPNQIPLGGTRRGTVRGDAGPPRSTPHAPAGALSGTHTPGSGGGTSRAAIAPATLGLWLAVGARRPARRSRRCPPVVRRRRRLRFGAGPGIPRPPPRAAWDEVVGPTPSYGIDVVGERLPPDGRHLLTAGRKLPEPAIAGLRLVALAEERSRYARTAGIDGDLPGAVPRSGRPSRAEPAGPGGSGRWWLPPSTLHTAGRAVRSTARDVERARRNIGDLPRRIWPARPRGAQR